MDVNKSNGEKVTINATINNQLSIFLEKDPKEKLGSIQNGIGALLSIIPEYIAKDIELERVCRVAILLNKSGLNQNNSIFQDLAEKCVSEQKNDGGWLGVIDTMWCTSFLNLYKEYSESVKSALSWLREQRHEDGSWGQTNRDIGRVITTGQILYFLPKLVSKSSLNWLENKWEQDLNIDIKLTYKGAFTLMAFKRNNYQPANPLLISETIRWLESQQNDDFGWGPWKGHAIGSDPWCTGISIVGLLHYHDKISENILHNSLEWLKGKQLINGLWPYHYIEKGSCWALYSLTSGYCFLSEERN